MTDTLASLRVTSGKRFRLASIDPGSTPGWKVDKAAAKLAAEKLNARLEALQELLHAEHKHKLLVVLQAMDTGGKDGTIRRVFDGVNPLGVRVASFKAPTPVELDHDYLWRAHAQVPGRGELTIFNRSHYEDVLVVRVHEFVPERVWRKRYAQIRDFERMLVEEGTTIVKFFLHISKDEQKERLQARLDDRENQWKFNPGDLKERELWDSYMAAYQEAVAETSTKDAPWYVVPANKKWYRDWAILKIMVDTLEGMKIAYPKPDFDPKTIRIK